MSEWLKNAIEALSKQNKGHIKVGRYKSNQPTNDSKLSANHTDKEPIQTKMYFLLISKFISK